METSLFKWEKYWAETALPGVGHHILAILDHSALREGDVAGNPAPTLLEPGLREQTTTP